MLLGKDFYQQTDVVAIAKTLLGKVLYTNVDNVLTSGIITETEAYEGVTDKASHTYGGRRTKRTEIMYSDGGVSYVYLCYGLHHLFNVITNQKDVPHAILVRSVQPLEGIDKMMERRKKSSINNLTSGPGCVSQALGINVKHTGTILYRKEKIWIEDNGIMINPGEIETTERIGIGYAAEDALLPYRFYVKRRL
jgi:DNA-3-methyladenine glycosylase